MNPEERERIIERLLDEGGIHGAEVCQLCGKLDTFSGWADAMQSHDSHEFVPFQHGHVESDSITGVKSYGPKARSQLSSLLAAAEDRFCEVCFKRVKRSEARRVRNCWLCPVCAPGFSEDEDEALKALGRLSSRRYLETKPDEVLLSWGRQR